MLRLDQIGKTYRIGTFGGGTLEAVRDVSFDVNRGEVVALIGESGSGKSTIGQMVLKLTETTNGAITFGDVDVPSLKGRHLRDYYTKVQGVFQDPFSSFNPIFKVDRTFDTLRQSYFPDVTDDDWQERVEGAIREVSLFPDDTLGRFPHQLSGGQLQRLLIARALLLDIDLLVADEIISMLDASSRIDILNLLADLRSRGLGVLFVTHDLSLGHYISDRTVVLLEGRVVESGDTPTVFDNPMHPYTRRLLTAVPHLDRKWADMEAAMATRDAELANRCPMHEHVGPGAPTTRLYEVEPGHDVACFAPGRDAACPLDQDLP